MRTSRAVRNIVSTFSSVLCGSKRPFPHCNRVLGLTQHLDLNNQFQKLKTSDSAFKLGSRFYYSTDVVRARRYPKHLKGNLRMMKVESEYFKELVTPELEALHKLFQKYGYEIRMAGGVVRDLLAGKKSVDVDFATTATPDEMKEMFEREGVRMINTKGERHGTITARINDKENFEVTTLRIDVTTDGRHAEVQFTKNWELDAGRRDLTVNSMFLDFDGEPSDRIQEDYLRILRYFRFYGRISPNPNEHESTILEAIRENISGLKQISGERIWVELRKILTGNHAAAIMVTMMELGIGEYIGLPNDANIEEFKMLMNRLDHLKLEVNPITLLSAFLRDEKDVSFSISLKLSF
ncbi:unnamed protein product [Allacma fusca]|uniref:CCA tRNA nucleotidyltransferase 1, mitochondrial n=2 Tax=Allacma fusca TaxID=39272 RepID=A0A8J2PZG4_9HEXA|nr:unnamed protein product [Allacma fusca]